MERLWVGIRTPTLEQAERLAAAVRDDFTVAIEPGGSYTVRVTPGRDAAEKIVVLFNSIGRWLTESGLASCDVIFGDRGMTILPATAGNLGDPTAFLIERSRQLETALSSRIVIEQAKGVLAERHGLEPDEAFTRLRQEARSTRRNIHELAGDIVAGRVRL